jgi:hypothetical protein
MMDSLTIGRVTAVHGFRIKVELDPGSKSPSRAGLSGVQTAVAINSYVSFEIGAGDPPPGRAADRGQPGERAACVSGRLADRSGALSRPRAPKAGWLFFESPSRFRLLLEHDVLRKPVSTFRHHALGNTRCPPADGPMSHDRNHDKRHRQQVHDEVP